jgi:hypothetical protein
MKKLIIALILVLGMVGTAGAKPIIDAYNCPESMWPEINKAIAKEYRGLRHAHGGDLKLIVGKLCTQRDLFYPHFCTVRGIDVVVYPCYKYRPKCGCHYGDENGHLACTCFWDYGICKVPE